MLKVLTIVCFWSLSSLASTAPGAGSYSKYIYRTSDKTGKVSLGTEVDSVISVQNQNYQVQTQVTMADHENQNSIWNLSGNYFSNTQYFIDNCVASGGEIANVKVPAGQFRTCHILFHAPDEQCLTQEVWLTQDVPLFVVRQIRTANDKVRSVTKLELQAYQLKAM